MFVSSVSVAAYVFVDAFGLHVTRAWSAKALESSKDSLFALVVILKQFFDFPERWTIFFVLVWVWQVLEKCCCSFFFALLLCFFYSLFSVWHSAFGLTFSLCLCNFDFVEWKYLLFSLHFDCNVFFLLRYVFFVFSVFILSWKHVAFSRECWTLINGWKWRRWKLWYASCCFSFHFPCVCVFFLLDNLTITSSVHRTLSFVSLFDFHLLILLFSCN